MIQNIEGFIVQEIRGVDEVIAYWPLFQEGLRELNEITREDKQISPSTFFRVLQDTATGDKEQGLVLVVSSKNNKPLMFAVYFNNTTKYQQNKSLLCYAAYSNNKSRTVIKWSLRYAKEWAKMRGYDELQAFSPRFQGSGYYWFEKVLGFRRFLVFFTQSL